MAKFLALKRATRQVVTVDTTNQIVADLGTAITTVDTTSSFPGRTENVLAVYRGSPYLLYRTASNEIKLSRMDIATLVWADVAGFTTITPGTGFITSLGLHVVKDRLVAVMN